MTTSTWRGGLPIAIAVPPPQGITVASASEQRRNAALTCSRLLACRATPAACRRRDEQVSEVGIVTDSVSAKLGGESLRQSIGGRLHLTRSFALAIGAVEEIHEMINFHLGSVSLRAVAKLQHAAGIGRDDGFGFQSPPRTAFFL